MRYGAASGERAIPAAAIRLPTTSGRARPRTLAIL